MTSTEQKMLSSDLHECLKVIRSWDMSEDVILEWFRRYFKQSMWAQKPKGQTYILWHSLPESLQRKLDRVQWVQACQENHARDGTLKALDGILAVLVMPLFTKNSDSLTCIVCETTQPRAS